MNHKKIFDTNLPNEQLYFLIGTMLDNAVTTQKLLHYCLMTWAWLSIASMFKNHQANAKNNPDQLLVKNRPFSVRNVVILRNNVVTEMNFVSGQGSL